MTTINIILLSIIAALAAALIIVLIRRPEVVVLSDEMPKDDRPATKVLKLQNELINYVYEEDGKVCIKVVK